MYGPEDKSAPALRAELAFQQRLGHQLLGRVADLYASGQTYETGLAMQDYDAVQDEVGRLQAAQKALPPYLVSDSDKDLQKLRQDPEEEPKTHNRTEQWIGGVLVSEETLKTAEWDRMLGVMHGPHIETLVVQKNDKTVRYEAGQEFDA